MNDNQFVNLFMRLNPHLKVVIQRNKPDDLKEGYQYIALKTEKSGMDYFDKGIFRFQETTRGFNKFVFTSQINGQLLEEVILGKNTLCRKLYGAQGKPQMTFCYQKVSNCIQEEIFDEYNELKERSIYRPNSQNDIDFPTLYFQGNLRHHRPAYLLKGYQSSFGDNCTQSVYDYDGRLTQQEIHKNGKVVKIKQRQNPIEKLLKRPRARISYTEDSLGKCRETAVKNIKEAQQKVSHSEFLKIKHDNVNFYRSKFAKQKS